jgi:DNA replication initiation complex subunit (GINS family)
MILRNGTVISPDFYQAVLSVLKDLEGEVSKAFLAEELCRAVVAVWPQDSEGRKGA